MASSFLGSDKFNLSYPYNKIKSDPILKNFVQNVVHILDGKKSGLTLNTIDDWRNAGLIQVSAQRYGGVLPSIGASSHIPEEHWVPVYTWTGCYPLFRGTTALTAELAGFEEQNLPRERLIWTTWECNIALGYSTRFSSGIDDLECGVILYNTLPLPNLLHVPALPSLLREVGTTKEEINQKVQEIFG